MSTRGLLRALLAVTLLPALAIGAPGAPASAAAKPARTLAVAIDGMRFAPATLAVRPGDHVVWTNRDLVPHTVTARDGRFDSKSIAPNASFAWVAAGRGRVEYACLYHPAMTAALDLP